LIRILVIEDEYEDYLMAKGLLEDEFPGVIVVRLATELKFRRWIAQLQMPLPDLVILDNMLPWTVPAPELESPPEEVANAGPWNAGLRCYELLRARPECSHIPVIILTIAAIACPAGAEYVSKTDRSLLAAKAHNLLRRCQEERDDHGK
jgi:CheY-like chemotaxis protein